MSFGHPISHVEQIELDSLENWRIHFKNNANYNSGMMWDANLRRLDAFEKNYYNIFRLKQTCTCSDKKKCQ